MYSLVVPFSQSFDDVGFFYKIPESLEKTLKIWQVVVVPFWKKEIFWVVIDITENANISDGKIKEIKEIFIQKNFLFPYQLNLLKWISKNYFCLIHNSLWLFFPKNLEKKIMTRKFFFNTEEDFSYTYNNIKILNIHQKEVFEKIILSDKNKFFLYWVTWSWKTEVYINLIKHFLDKWKQSLFLVPEIILNDQIFERIKLVFGEKVLVINSSLSEARKTKYWENIHNWEAKIIIWTRSSIFYPYRDLWLIIMDEEHDNSYVSDVSPRYDSFEVVNKISELENVKVVFWSATPKVQHMYDVLHWKYELLNLFEEFK